MPYFHRIIILSCILFSPGTFALDFMLDALYWQATETVDWVLINNLSTTNQTITYKTSEFDFSPGFRIGAGYTGEWNSKFYYTKFHAKSTSSANGNLVSTFMAGKLVQGNNFFYHTGQLDFTIDFNMFDLDLGKSFQATEKINIVPLLGLRGGWINQKIVTKFQGQTNITETVKNNFNGIGPKIGLESKVNLYKHGSYKINLAADFFSSYMWGNWGISDVTDTSAPETLYINVGSRNFSSFAVQALLGIGVEYKHLSMKLGYEISDWFNQYQVLDDGTGAHNNDLILQGLTLNLVYRL